MNIKATIYSERLDESKRVTQTDKLFGIYFPMLLEPSIFSMAGKLSNDYTGGYWHFYALSNGGFYLAPEIPETLSVKSENGYACEMTADALGITACLYAYSHLSFTDLGKFSETCARQYHLLRECVFEHQEAKLILKVID